VEALTGSAGGNDWQAAVHATESGYRMVEATTHDERVSGLVRIGEKELTGEDEAAVDAYFAAKLRFYGPDGREWDYQGLKGYFAALRAAFDDLTITRGIIVVEGDHVACQTTIVGIFVGEFTHSPVGRLPPNGNRVVFELMNIFRYDDAGRLAEEWIQTDNRSVLCQLGAEGR
jgi:predicted ester cyclase